MAEPRATGSMPPHVAEQVRAYLAALLPPGEVDDAVSEVATDSGYWGDTDGIQILAVAHAVVTSRLRVAPEVEVLVLNEDVGLDVVDIAAVLGLSTTDVRRVLDEALAALAEEDTSSDAVTTGATPVTPATPPASEDADPRVRPATARGTVSPSPAARRRQRMTLVLAALGIAVVAIVAAWVLGRSDGCPSAAPLCVTSSALTDGVEAATGRPGDDRETFALGEDVTLWFAFDRRVPDPGIVEVRWYRDGVVLYATDVRLGSGGELNVSLVALWAEEPGRYRVEVAADDRVLLTRDFRITA